jgi:uncharacterized membrane protein
MRLPASLRLALYTAGALVAASGLAWFASPSARSVSMEIHGGASMALLVVIGAVAALHAPAGWRERKNRWSGALVAAGMSVLAVTGFLLYYLGDERARAGVSRAHWAVGLAVSVLLGMHVWLGARLAKSS